MPIDAARLKAVQDRLRAGEVTNAQGMLLDLQYEQEQAELEEQIAAGNPPPPPDAGEILLNLLEAIVQHAGSPATLVKHLVMLKGSALDNAKISVEENADAAKPETEHSEEQHAS